MSNTKTVHATTSAPVEWKTIGIHAGASSMIQVNRPGAASKNRAPNWRIACSQTGAGGRSWTSSTDRLWLRNRNWPFALVSGMENIQHFDGPTFEADVLQAAEPVVVDFYADWCPPCRMMDPAVETLAGEFAGKVKFGKLNVDS